VLFGTSLDVVTFGVLMAMLAAGAGVAFCQGDTWNTWEYAEYVEKAGYVLEFVV
jgi:hypothetical protein